MPALGSSGPHSLSPNTGSQRLPTRALGNTASGPGVAKDPLNGWSLETPSTQVGSDLLPPPPQAFPASQLENVCLPDSCRERPYRALEDGQYPCPDSNKILVHGEKEEQMESQFSWGFPGIFSPDNYLHPAFCCPFKEKRASHVLIVECFY